MGERVYTRPTAPSRSLSLPLSLPVYWLLSSVPPVRDVDNTLLGTHYSDALSSDPSRYTYVHAAIPSTPYLAESNSARSTYVQPPFG